MYGKFIVGTALAVSLLAGAPLVLAHEGASVKADAEVKSDSGFHFD